MNPLQNIYNPCRGYAKADPEAVDPRLIGKQGTSSGSFFWSDATCFRVALALDIMGDALRSPRKRFDIRPLYQSF